MRLVMTVLACGVCLGSGCSSGGLGSTGGGVLPPTTVTLGDVQPIFSNTCAVATCHIGADAPHELDLSAGLSYGNTVGVPSEEQGQFDRVDPGDAEDSYLYMKITADPRITGDPMPAFGDELSDPQKELIRTWIDQGANP